jgi:hypothetical protein
MQALVIRGDTPLVLRGIPIPPVRVQVVDAIRVWADPRGKTHFDFQRVRPTRTPAQCVHVGTFRVGARVLPYTWSRSATFGLRCGNCGAPLD